MTMQNGHEQKGRRRGLIALLLLIGIVATGMSLYLFGGKALFSTDKQDANAAPVLGYQQSISDEPTIPRIIQAQASQEALPSTPKLVDQASTDLDLPTSAEVKKALEAALSDTPEGRAVVQNYFDRSGGNAEALRKRGHRLVLALKDVVESSEPVDDILVPVQAISDALDNTAEAVFVVPVLLDTRHKSTGDSIAYDFGPEGKPAFSNFKRFAAGQDPQDTGVTSTEDSSQSLLLNDGLEGISSLSLKAKQGHMQAILLTTGFKTASADRPFVDGLSVEGRNSRVVWLDDLTPPTTNAGAQWMELAEDQVIHHAWSEIHLPQTDTPGEQPVMMGYAAILPAIPIIGDLDLKFHQVVGARPVLNGAIIRATEVPVVVDEVKRILWDLYSPPIIAVLPEINAEDRPDLGSVTVADALQGAIAGTEDGLDQLQAFMDATAGDLDELRYRAEALLNALSKTNIANNFILVADTANRILESAINSAQSGYIMPAYISPDFKLNDKQTGWDFGSRDKNAFNSFSRIGEDSTLVSGDEIQALEGLNEEALTNNALIGVKGFYPELPDGSYRLFLLAPAKFEGNDIAHPFGTEVRLSGGRIKIQDLRHADPPIWGRFSIDGFTLHDGANSIENYLPSSKNGPLVAELSAAQSYNPEEIPEANSLIMSARGLVEGGRLRLEFSLPIKEKSIISAIVADESDTSEFEDYLASKIASILPNSGPKYSDPIATNNAAPAPATQSNSGRGGGFVGGPGISPPATGIGGNTPSPTSPTPVDPINPPPTPIDPSDPIVITADAGGPYTVFFGDTVTFNGSAEFNVDPSLLSVEWLLDINGQDFVIVSGFADDINIFSPEFLADLPPGTYELILRLTFLDVVEIATTFLTVLQAAVPTGSSVFIFITGLFSLLVLYRRRVKKYGN
ncbi:MAG: hypothetical protein PVF65_02835 [Sphingomonadales bacterium]|jgi:hypothetical protein